MLSATRIQALTQQQEKVREKTQRLVGNSKYQQEMGKRGLKFQFSRSFENTKIYNKIHQTEARKMLPTTRIQTFKHSHNHEEKRQKN